METDSHSDKLTDLEDDEEKAKEGDDEIDQGEPETPQATRRTGPSRNKETSQTISSSSPSPSPSKKRARAGDEDVEMEDIEPAPSPAPEQTQEPVVEEVVVRRKRLRA